MAESVRQKGWVPFTTFAFVEEIPQRINFLEHLLPYKGADQDLTIPWGVYGTAGLNKVAYYATHYARARKRLSVEITVWYYLEEVGRSITKLARTIEECSGFMHVSRISSGLRDEMREELIDMARKYRSPKQIEEMDKLEGAGLLMQEPQLVREYLRNHEDLLVLVHPVQQQIDPHQEGGVQIASFKLRRDRIRAVEARYFPDMLVELELPASLDEQEIRSPGPRM
jgi:hypothetical protein